MFITSKQKYMPIEQQQDSDETNVDENICEDSVSEYHHIKPAWRSCYGMICLVVFLVSIIIFQQTRLMMVTCPTSRHTQSSYTRDGQEHPRNLSRVAHAPNLFLSNNEIEADAAWESIQAGHGAVAIDPTWSDKHQMSDTMRHPSDSTKGVYLIAAYHDMHCVQWLRRHFKALLKGEPITWPIEHDWHCFDSLRQQTMCHADDTLLYCSGRGNIGNDQVRHCRDWDALRDWATEHTAGYFDYEGPPVTVSRWGNSDGGDDGLPRGSLLG